ncbi:hypothetical protein GGR54DRAFT_652540 [Hypoxylon sp. NC1633]|nr:hypothetical protein GGR54DRAFT_652540 [Hypoxylon sp. NC1633]
MDDWKRLNEEWRKRKYLGYDINATCLSNKYHDYNIKDHLLHYFGCLRDPERKVFLEPEFPIWQQEIEHQESIGHSPKEAKEIANAKRNAWKENRDRELRRIEFLRKTLNQDPEDKHLVAELTNSLGLWRRQPGRQTPEQADNSPNSQEDSPGTSNQAESISIHSEYAGNNTDTSPYDPAKDVKVPIIQFKNGKGITVPVTHPEDLIWSEFPNQKTSLYNLLEAKHNLLFEDRQSDGMLRYFHIPSNNMIHAISRYFGQARPDYRAIHRELNRQRKSRAYNILREKYWHNQLYGGSQNSLPHSRHMRPLCEIISSEPVKTNDSPNNMVLFMPYLHWDTSRKREQFANEIDYLWYKHIDEAQTPSTMRGLLKQMGIPKDDKEQDKPGLLGQLLLDAARLYEGMSNYRDKRLLRDYLFTDPPLHPRRTLDQAYRWKLKSTSVRDRDQVVYRSTSAKRETFHTCKGYDHHKQSWSWEGHEELERRRLERRRLERKRLKCEILKRERLEPERSEPERSEHERLERERLERVLTCNECKANIQKLSRIIMVDQLWLWILDEQTIITCFPKRYGTHKQDDSDIHESIRVRIRNGGDQIDTVLDLALIIIDECSSMIFNQSPATVDEQPQVIDAFSEAIGNIMDRQASAFQRLLHWTDAASNVFRDKRKKDTSKLHIPLLETNPEGSLDREIKDVIEELDIMIHITKTHKIILAKFMANARTILTRRTPRQHLWEKSKTEETVTDPVNKEPDAYARLKFMADERLENVSSRVVELEELRITAVHTADNVKDLMHWKQQQAGVIQAWQGVRQSEDNTNQGRSIMIFTLVTIIFLPLSFMSSVFGMNNMDITEETWSLHQEIVLIFLVSAVVIFVTLLAAFGPWIQAAVFYAWKCSVTTFLVYTGLYRLWIHIDIPSDKLHNRANEFADKLQANSMSARRAWTSANGSISPPTARHGREVANGNATGSTAEDRSGPPNGGAPEGAGTSWYSRLPHRSGRQGGDVELGELKNVASKSK